VIESAILIVFPFCMVFAAISDMLSMTIANRISIVLVATFALVAPFTGMEWSVYAWHFAAGFTVLLATFILFAVGGMGGGDAKLMAATAVYMGLGFNLMNYLVISAFVGGILTLLILVLRKSPYGAIAGNNIFLRNFADEKKGIPYGIALGIGGLVAYPDTYLMQWALDRLSTL
jgi:prepilin peptidase CpaA